MIIKKVERHAPQVSSSSSAAASSSVSCHQRQQRLVNLPPCNTRDAAAAAAAQWRGQGAEDGHLDVPDFDTLLPRVVFSTLLLAEPSPKPGFPLNPWGPMVIHHFDSYTPHHHHRQLTAHVIYWRYPNIRRPSHNGQKWRRLAQCAAAARRWTTPSSLVHFYVMMAAANGPWIIFEDASHKYSFFQHVAASKTPGSKKWRHSEVHSRKQKKEH